MIDSQFQRQLGRMEELIHALDEAADSPICRQARELVQMILKMHADALEHVLDSIHDNPITGQQLIDRLADDPLISNLLVLHGLHPLDLETRVRRALESVKPRLGLHGGDVDLIGVTPDGVVKLRLGRKLPWLSLVPAYFEVLNRRSHLRCGARYHCA